MSITNEEKAKIFALYLGCRTKCIGGHFNPNMNSKNGNGKLIMSAAIIADCEELTFQFGDFQLLLKGLQDITDEDAAELSEAFFPDGNIYDYLHGAPTGRAIVASIKNNRQTNTFYPHARIYDGFSFLISKGYAVPLFFGVGHPANGKTAVELGLAIIQPANKATK